MKQLMLFGALALSSLAHAQECQTSRLRGVVRDQDPAAPYTLVTVEGARLRLAGQDFIDPRAWRSGAALKICPEPSRPEAIMVWFKIENTDRGETLFGGTSRLAASAVR